MKYEGEPDITEPFYKIKITNAGHSSLHILQLSKHIFPANRHFSRRIKSVVSAARLKPQHHCWTFNPPFFEQSKHMRVSGWSVGLLGGHLSVFQQTSFNVCLLSAAVGNERCLGKKWRVTQVRFVVYAQNVAVESCFYTPKEVEQLKLQQATLVKKKVVFTLPAESCHLASTSHGSPFSLHSLLARFHHIPACESNCFQTWRGEKLISCTLSWTLACLWL